MHEYELRALIAAPPTLAAWEHGRAVASCESLWLVPLTEPPTEADVERLSVRGPVAHVEVDWFGGVGTERAALWVNGRRRLADVRVPEVLRALGVSSPDEVVAAGLLRHPSTLEWSAHAIVDEREQIDPRQPLRGLVTALKFNAPLRRHELESAVRRQAARRLGSMGRAARTALPALQVTSRSDRDPSVILECACAMARIGAEGIPMLLGALEDPTTREPRAIILALGEAGKEARSAVPAIQRRLLQEGDERVRAACAEVLGRLDADGSADTLVRALGDPSPFVRMRAAEGLGRGFDLYGSHLDALRSAMEDADPHVCSAATDALHRLESRYGS